MSPRPPSPRSRPERAASAGPRDAAKRILFLDVLDAVGADPADVAERAALLRGCGARVTALAIGEGLEERSNGSRAAFRSTAPALAAAAVRELLDGEVFDLALIASARRGCGGVAAALPASVPCSWWPTGLPAGPRGGILPSLGRAFGAREPESWLASDPGPAASPLAGAAVETPGSRRPPLPLWDGDVVLAPEGLDGRRGRTTLEAFASLADEWSSVDLLSWSTPNPVVVARARRLEVEPRVHEVGPPSRRAEWAWWSQARAVVLGGDTRVSVGLPLRALSVGCPLLFVTGEAEVDRLARHLVERGCAATADPRPRAVASELERLLARGPEVERAIERGRVLAAEHGQEALAARITAALGLAGPAAPRHRTQTRAA